MKFVESVLFLIFPNAFLVVWAVLFHIWLFSLCCSRDFVFMAWNWIVLSSMMQAVLDFAGLTYINQIVNPAM